MLLTKREKELQPHLLQLRLTVEPHELMSQVNARLLTLGLLVTPLTIEQAMISIYGLAPITEMYDGLERAAFNQLTILLSTFLNSWHSQT